MPRVNQKTTLPEEDLSTLICTSLPLSVFKELNNSWNCWSNHYLTFILNLLAKLTNLQTIHYIISSVTIIEAITILESEKKTIFIINDQILKEQFIKTLYSTTLLDKPITEPCHLPKRLKLTPIEKKIEFELNINLQKTLLLFYGIAHHAAYHYLSLESHSDCDYDHSHNFKLKTWTPIKP